MRRWGLYKDKNVWVIRRGSERLPAKDYQHIRNDEQRLRAYVKTLNAPSRAVEAVEFKHAYISPQCLEDYYNWLMLQIPNQFNARCEYNFLRTHFLNFFVGRLDLHRPEEWLRESETKWATYLTSDEVAPSPKTKRVIVQASNRFVEWMHRRYPEFMPKMYFEPLTKAMWKKLKADWEFNEDHVKRTFIKEEDWKVICRNMVDYLKPFVMLSYHYGLRRSEALGLREDDVKPKHLSIERQLVSSVPPKYAPLKGRESRKCPHWFASPDEAYDWVVGMTEVKLLTPKAFSNEWRIFMDSLGMTYDLHDLRHSFITKAVGKYPSKEVMHAVGHKNIETTMRYTHDDRGFEDTPYKPKRPPKP